MPRREYKVERVNDRDKEEEVVIGFVGTIVYDSTTMFLQSYKE